MKRLALFLITTLFAGIPAAGVKYVAVLETEIDASAKIAKAEAHEVTEEIRRQAVKNLPRDKYSIMTTESVIAQGDIVAAECNESNCVFTTGRKIGADYVVRGTIRKIQTRFTLSVVIYDTDNETLVASSDPVRSEKIATLIENAAGACGEMFRGFVNPGAQNAPAQGYTQTVPPAPAATPPVNQAPATTYQQSQGGVAGTFNDKRDGKTYRFVTIGGKTWMAENLNYQAQTGKSWCYENKVSNCNKYGRLYDWNTAMKACPVGWHLPSDQEWDELITSAGGDFAAGKALKAASGWGAYDGGSGNGADDFGFSALPGGRRNSDGSANGSGYWGWWWSANVGIDEQAWGCYMYGPFDRVGWTEDYSRRCGYSARCVRD
jgi:uncharacterized protein (TIGR02145 family)